MAHRIVNTEHAAAWDGEEGEFWLIREDNYNRAMKRYAARLDDLAQIVAGERVLDVGCGCGETTRDAARRSTPGNVLGIDLSSRMLARARERALGEQVANVTFEQGDAQVYPFSPHSRDVIISRFGVMFFNDPTAAFQNLRSALSQGGRLSLIVWRGLEHNEWIRELRHTFAAGRTLPSPPLCAPGPLGLSDPDAVRRILTEAEYKKIQLTEISEPLWYGATVDAAFEFLSGTTLALDLSSDLSPTQKSKALNNLHTLIAQHHSPRGVQFQSSAWHISALR